MPQPFIVSEYIPIATLSGLLARGADLRWCCRDRGGAQAREDVRHAPNHSRDVKASNGLFASRLPVFIAMETVATQTGLVSEPLAIPHPGAQGGRASAAGLWGWTAALLTALWGIREGHKGLRTASLKGEPHRYESPRVASAHAHEAHPGNSCAP